jgi:hypothetical protein
VSDAAWLVIALAMCALTAVYGFRVWRDETPGDPRVEPVKKAAGGQALVLAALVIGAVILLALQAL